MFTFCLYNLIVKCYKCIVKDPNEPNSHSVQVTTRCKHNPANMTHRTNVSLLLAHCLRRCSDIKPTFFQCVVFAGSYRFTRALCCFIFIMCHMDHFLVFMFTSDNAQWKLKYVGRYDSLVAPNTTARIGTAMVNVHRSGVCRNVNILIQ